MGCKKKSHCHTGEGRYPGLMESDTEQIVGLDPGLRRDDTPLVNQGSFVLFFCPKCALAEHELTNSDY